MDEKLGKALAEIYASLTDEQKKKAQACKNMDELTTLAGKEGIELPDELLDAVAGGIVLKHDSGWYEVIDGEGRSTAENELISTEAYAQEIAVERGQSTEVIDMTEYLKRFGDTSKLSNPNC